MENKYYFEYYKNNIDLVDYLNNYELGTIEKPFVIYIKNSIEINDNSHIKVRLRKPFDYYINYNDMEESSFINIAININVSDKKKLDLKIILENIKKYIESKLDQVNIYPIYSENPTRPNIISFYCKFIPDILTKKHRIFEIKEYLIKTLWDKNKFNFERAKKGYTDLSTFRNKLIKANNQKQQLKLFPDFEPVLKICDKFNKEKNTYERHAILEYNIRQIYFVDADIVPDPIF